MSTQPTTQIGPPSKPKRSLVMIDDKLPGGEEHLKTQTLEEGYLIKRCPGNTGMIFPDQPSWSSVYPDKIAYDLWWAAQWLESGRHGLPRFNYDSNRALISYVQVRHIHIINQRYSPERVLKP